MKKDLQHKPSGVSAGPYTGARALPGAPDEAAIFEAAGALGFSPNSDACRSLAVYLGLLVKWNRVMNLVGPGSWREIFDNLILDSFHLAHLLPELPLPPAPRCRDLGAGAGLPGIPLRALWQEGEYVLVEAREKRALFLRSVLAACPLPGVRVERARAEDYLAAEGGGNLILSRAFMPWQEVLNLISPHCRRGTLCLFLCNAPPPPFKASGGWELLTAKSYQAVGRERFFWVFRSG